MLDVELLGYLGSLFVGISLLMTNMKRLRYINFVGCVMFVVYGLFIHAPPVVVMNAFCALINVYHIAQLIRTR